ncbi:hypothetical protein PACTADRAFT_40691 [Pachysolen tannophilus NRRL Y-2460]|uniref:Mitochondrial fusion and transport protein UGO1 n=1 Tax=Pachysolen tannophilus NRRL Y-2460 TaxID=669874 RepID=A0A1E4TVG0_PACTA|nr:hypothetical protein PACTADRAFT_40691 [Pachysolen tannophilus NRRL Y-2460]
MSNNKDVNLRPYYKPVEFNHNLYEVGYNAADGVIDHRTGKPISASLPTTLQFNNNNGHHHGNITSIGLANSNGIRTLNKGKISTIHDANSSSVSDKNMYSDLEFQEYFDYNNLRELIKSLINSFIKNYVRILISQPFEVSKLLLQVGSFNTSIEPKNVGYQEKKYLDSLSDVGDDEEDDENDEIDFFVAAPDEQDYSMLTSSPKDDSKKQHSRRKQGRHHIQPLSLHTIDIMSSLLSKEGTKGLWRSINTSFIYQTLSNTIEAWLTGFLSPLLNIPDPFFIDIIHSSNPFKSLCLSIVAGVLTGLVLQPVELIKFKFSVTSTNLNFAKRSFRKTITSFEPKNFLIPYSLILPAFNYFLSANFIKKYVPYLLFTKFNIDNYTSPVLYSATTLLTSISELFIKLPLELLLRRAQFNYLLNDETCNEALKIEKDELSVKFGGYYGYLPTLYYVYKGTRPHYIEESDDNYDDFDKENENKGFEAIFRGWRVGLLNVLGSWGAGVLKNNFDENTKEERF